MSDCVSPRVALARDLAISLEDAEAARVDNRKLARRNLERRYGIPRTVFWNARNRVRRTLEDYLTRLIEAKAAELRREIHELEVVARCAQRAGGDDLSSQIAEATALIDDARARLRDLRARGD